MTEEDDIKQLETERQAQITKLFVLAVEIAFIIAIPAFLVLGLGKMFGKMWWIIGFPVAIILSWAIIVSLYRRLNKKMTDLDRRIKELKENKS